MIGGASLDGKDFLGEQPESLQELRKVNQQSMSTFREGLTAQGHQTLSWKILHQMLTQDRNLYPAEVLQELQVKLLG